MMTNEERDRLIVKELGGGYDLIYFNLSTPNGFFWMWERATKMSWWGAFCAYSLLPYENLVRAINPDRFADALAEFLTQRKEES